jgi:hypothetical protein
VNNVAKPAKATPSAAVPKSMSTSFTNHLLARRNFQGARHWLVKTVLPVSVTLGYPVVNAPIVPTRSQCATRPILSGPSVSFTARVRRSRSRPDIDVGLDGRCAYSPHPLTHGRLSGGTTLRGTPCWGLGLRSSQRKK